MEELLAKTEYDFMKQEDKDFIIAFDNEMNKLGYTCGENIGNGYCWGKYMIIYTKAGVKSKKSYARVYIRENDTVLRLYFSDVEKHRDAIEQAPDYVQDAFIGEYPSCDHCHNKTDCVNQKRYTINGQQFEICDGKAFWFFGPNANRLAEYIKVFTAFYPLKNKSI